MKNKEWSKLSGDPTEPLMDVWGSLSVQHTINSKTNTTLPTEPTEEVLTGEVPEEFSEVIQPEPFISSVDRPKIIDKLKKERRKRSTKVDPEKVSLDQQVKSLLEEREGLQARITSLEESTVDKGVYDSELEKLRAEKSKLDEKLNEANGKLTEQEKQHSEKVGILSSEVATLKANNEERDRLLAGIKKLIPDETDIATFIEELSSSKSELQTKLDELEVRYNLSTAQADELKERIQGYKHFIAKGKEYISQKIKDTKETKFKEEKEEKERKLAALKEKIGDSKDLGSLLDILKENEEILPLNQKTKYVDRLTNFYYGKAAALPVVWRELGVTAKVLDFKKQKFFGDKVVLKHEITDEEVEALFAADEKRKEQLGKPVEESEDDILHQIISSDTGAAGKKALPRISRRGVIGKITDTTIATPAIETDDQKESMEHLLGTNNFNFENNPVSTDNGVPDPYAIESEESSEYPEVPFTRDMDDDRQEPKETIEEAGEDNLDFFNGLGSGATIVSAEEASAATAKEIKKIDSRIRKLESSRIKWFKGLRLFFNADAKKKDQEAENKINQLKKEKKALEQRSKSYSSDVNLGTASSEKTEEPATHSERVSLLKKSIKESKLETRKEYDKLLSERLVEARKREMVGRFFSGMVARVKNPESRRRGMINVGKAAILIGVGSTIGWSILGLGLSKGLAGMLAGAATGAAKASIEKWIEKSDPEVSIFKKAIMAAALGGTIGTIVDNLPRPVLEKIQSWIILSELTLIEKVKGAGRMVQGMFSSDISTGAPMSLVGEPTLPYETTGSIPQKTIDVPAPEVPNKDVEVFEDQKPPGFDKQPEEITQPAPEPIPVPETNPVTPEKESITTPQPAPEQPPVVPEPTLTFKKLNIADMQGMIGPGKEYFATQGLAGQKVETLFAEIFRIKESRESLIAHLRTLDIGIPESVYSDIKNNGISAWSRVPPIRDLTAIQAEEFYKKIADIAHKTPTVKGSARTIWDSLTK